MTLVVSARRRCSSWLLALSLALLLTGRVAGQTDKPAGPQAPDESVPEGHSYQGHVFNEGPRQRAYLMEGTGRAKFPVTTTSESAQQFVTQGLGQLYGFWYFEAERSFRQAAALDPDCAMAYWGMAQANWRNETRAKGFVAEAVKRKGKVSRREQLYIESIDAYFKADPKKSKERDEAYAKALERLLYEFPDDNEARALLTLQLYTNRGSSTSYLAIDALLDKVFQVEPLHPAHHFRIHLWDYERAENAVASAALCGESAPSIAHMWHMSGHIYSRLKRYHEAVWQQEASARVDHAHMIRDRVLPDQIHNFAHNNEWLIRNLNYIGRAQDARRLAENMLELPRHPKYNTATRRGGSAHYGRMRLIETLENYELWGQAVERCQDGTIEATDDLDMQLERERLLARAYTALGRTAECDTLLAGVRERLVAKRAEQTRAEELAEAKLLGEKAPDLARTTAAGKPLPPVEGEAPAAPSEELRKEISKARTDGGKPHADVVKKLERTEQWVLGWQAAAAGRPAEAFELLKKAGDADGCVLAKLQFAAGEERGDDAEQQKGIDAIAKHVGSHKNEVLPLACHVELLWRAGKRDEAVKVFEQLRAFSGQVDLDTPPLQRLAPLALELGWGEDWRTPWKMGDDFGARPDLESLGPFRWHPSPAPTWQLKDAEGNEHALADHAGRPLVVIFYLGYGCLHCAEQLHKFAPLEAKFREAGLDWVAISSDDAEGLRISIRNYKEGLPIPLLSDPQLEVFKAYRCFDDFENLPLHGTFLIDAEGRVRWQDIGFEPFMEPQFVLDEAKRLLAK